MEKSDKKSRNWLSRLKYLKLRRQSSSCSKINCSNEENIQRNLSAGDNANLPSRHTLHFQRRSSFRKTINNVQNRVRNAFRRTMGSSRHPSDYSLPSSHMNSRVRRNWKYQTVLIIISMLTYSTGPMSNKFHLIKPKSPMLHN